MCKFDSYSLFNNTYGLLVLTRTTEFQIKSIMFPWTIYRLFVLNRGWKRDSLQIMIFVNICTSWSMVHLKTRFETWKALNYAYGVSMFHLYNLITLMAYVCSLLTPKVQINYFMLEWSINILLVPYRGCKRHSLQVMIFVYVALTRVIVKLIACVETWIKWNGVNGVSLFNLSYLIKFKAYLCTQRTPNAQLKYFVFDWSIYRLFVLNGGWKRDSFQIMIFVYVCSIWSIIELKTRFETWITRNYVNDINFFTFLI
jgi:hypothetical protein